MSAGIAGTLFARLIVRQWRLAPRGTLLLTAILAVGVAVYVSVRLANRAAVASFSHFTDTLTGQSDWIIRAPVGSLSESVLPEIRERLGSRPVHIVPVVEATAAAPAASAEGGRFGRPSYTLLGVDLIGVSNLARTGEGAGSYFGQDAPDRAAQADGAGEFWRQLRSGPRVWISPELPEGRPDRIALILDERVVELPVAGVIPTAPDSPRVPPRMLVMELADLQTLLRRPGVVDRVEFVLESGPRADERRAELRETLVELGAERWTVTSPGARRESAEVMTRAFRLNLTVLSLIALLVGLYLIFQALDSAVVRRRGEIATLRSLGVDAPTIRRVWLTEAAVLGLVGGTLGVALGWLGAQGTVRAVGQTVNALYFGTTVAAADLSWTEALLGVALGVVTALIAGWWPAAAAARTPPAHVLHRSAGPEIGSRWIRSPGLAALALIAALGLAQLPALPLPGGGRFPLAGYAAAFLAIFGGGILSSFMLPLIARTLRIAGGHLAPVRVALSHLRLPSGRHRLAAAALHCAIGMTAGMAILVGSFDLTVRTWVERTLQADLYLSSDGVQSADAVNRISAQAVKRIMAHPAVEAANRLTAWDLELDGQPTQLTAVDFALVRSRTDLPWVVAPPTELDFTQPAADGTVRVAVSESFTERFGRSAGDRLRLPLPGGPREVVIAAVFADYGNEQGAIMIERQLLNRWIDDPRATSLALWLRPGADPETVRADLLATYPGLSVLTNSRLRTEILRIFRQTFAITYALELIGVAVAVAGLALTLTSVLLDRRDELTTLRALGFSRREIASSAAMEGAALAGVAVLGGLLLSLGLGWLLIHVINKQSFGWTLGFAIPWSQLAALALGVIACGAAVGYAVGRWGANLPADREE